MACRERYESRANQHDQEVSPEPVATAHDSSEFVLAKMLCHGSPNCANSGSAVELHFSKKKDGGSLPLLHKKQVESRHATKSFLSRDQAGRNHSLKPIIMTNS